MFAFVLVAIDLIEKIIEIRYQGERERERDEKVEREREK